MFGHNKSSQGPLRKLQPQWDAEAKASEEVHLNAETRARLATKEERIADEHAKLNPLSMLEVTRAAKNDDTNLVKLLRHYGATE